MAHHRGVARDEYGNSISGASVTVYDVGTTTASTIYSEGTLTTAEDNPLTTGDDGVYEFFCNPGTYDITITKAGYTTTTLSDVEIGSVFAVATQVASTNSDTVATSYVPIDTTFDTLTMALSPSSVANGFSLDATDHLVYDGTETRPILFTVSLYCSASAADIFYFKLESDDGPTSVIESQSYLAVTNPYALSFQGIKMVDSGEEFTFSIKKDSTTSTLTVAKVTISAVGL